MPLAEFAEIPESNIKDSEGIAIDEIQSVGFRNFTIRYQSSDKTGFKGGISFTVNKGADISTAGLNNAGKSTITKLPASPEVPSIISR